jgi:hypothetical protein
MPALWCIEYKGHIYHLLVTYQVCKAVLFSHHLLTSQHLTILLLLPIIYECWSLHVYTGILLFNSSILLFHFSFIPFGLWASFPIADHCFLVKTLCSQGLLWHWTSGSMQASMCWICHWHFPRLTLSCIACMLITVWSHSFG